jgi:hypothetical protein
MSNLIQSVADLLHLGLKRKTDPRYVEHYCLYRSLYLYNLCKAVNPSGNYKVNIVVDKEKEWGHAWLTKDEKAIMKARQTVPFKIERVGENEVFTYWIIL